MEKYLLKHLVVPKESWVVAVNKKEKKLVESVLFSASQPVSIAQIKEATELSRKKIKSILQILMKEYETTRDSAMEIVHAGEKYAMQLKNEYSAQTYQVSSPDINEDMLKTLALIAFHQPVKQSNLRRMAGEKIYSHVDVLSEMKLIHTKKHRNTELITLTSKFPEYFGLDVTQPEDIRAFLLEKIVQDSTQTSSK
jgi:segregation and condensation protein B